MKKVVPSLKKVVLDLLNDQKRIALILILAALGGAVAVALSDMSFR